MLINSQKFGPLEIPENKIITMVKPVLGFEKLTRFCLVEMDEFQPFLWFQSVEEAAIAFIVVSPIVFYQDYRVEINPNEIAELDPTDAELVETYVIASVPEDWKKMTINLQGPILVNTENNKAKQLVLMNTSYQVQHPVFEQEESTPAVVQAISKESVGV